MVGAPPVAHYFAPQSSVIHVVNIEHLGLYGLEDLPSYFQPTADCFDFTQRLIDRVVQAEGTEFVLNEEDYTGKSASMRFLGQPGSLSFIVGPEGLEQSLGGRRTEDPRSWLWDKGPLENELIRSFLRYEV